MFLTAGSSYGLLYVKDTVYFQYNNEEKEKFQPIQLSYEHG
jgi:hypothetical protein